MQTKPQTDFSPIETILMHVQAFAAIREALRLQLFDTLETTPLSAAQVAEKHGLSQEPALALLNMFASYGLLDLSPQGYRNTPLTSEYLVSTSPFYQAQNLELHSRFIQQINGDISKLLRGEASTQEAVDSDWGLEESMLGSAQHALEGTLQDTVAFITALEDFSAMRTCCDIGGNHGEFSIALLESNPNLRGEIADLPQVVPAITERIAGRGYADRLGVVACDLRTSRLPEQKYDLILASHVLYGFTDDLPNFLRMLHAALRPGGWFVSQHMDPKGNLPPEYTSVVEFITRVSGYKTHYIARETLTDALRQAGFETPRSAPAGPHQGGLLVAAQKSKNDA